jgi:predicted PurR-regulated permease PerM
MQMDTQETQRQGDINGRGGRKWDIRPYLPLIATVIIIVAVCLVIFFLIFRYQGFGHAIGAVARALQAVIFGIFIAYLINPMMKFCERRLFRLANKRGKELTTKCKKRFRIISVAFGMIIFLLIIAVLLLAIIPQVVESFQDISETIGEQLTTFTQWVESLSTVQTPWGGDVNNMLEQMPDYILQWLQNNVFSQGNTLIESITSGIVNVIRIIVNMVIGLIVAVYLLMTKERFIGQMKKAVYAIFKPRAGNVAMDILRKINRVFGGFFIGDIVDSIIVGVICFVGVTIMQMPYPMLLALIIGVTNLIPIFGPFIGAIPCALLLLLDNPIQAVYFVIFICILQLFDGNILKPKVLGDTIGLSPFWILFSILLFGGLFGIGGFIFGVPMFAVIYYVIKRIIEALLVRKKLPTKTIDYVNVTKMNVEEQTLILNNKHVRGDILYDGKVGKAFEKRINPADDADQGNNNKES